MIHPLFGSGPGSGGGGGVGGGGGGRDERDPGERPGGRSN